jgi:hypothetical protein
MIVNATNDGWQVIYHRAHALLAAELAAQWCADERPTRWVETLTAIARHDDGGDAFEGKNHLTAAGAPLDFRNSTETSLTQPREATQEAEYVSQWVALLISMHTSYLYESLRSEGKEFAEFLDTQREHQTRWGRELGLKKGEAERAYALFRWCDRLSLILCSGELPDAERRLEVDDAPDGTRSEVMQRADGTVTVTPWPFESERFTVGVEARVLSRLAFKDDAELMAALQATPPQRLVWEFVK